MTDRPHETSDDDDDAEGYWVEGQDGDRVWCAYAERSRCGGSGWMNCYCGGDLCVCGNQGEIECYGCPDCEREDDYADDEEYPDE